MQLSSLSLFSFKNYAEEQFPFSQGLNLITGLNGSGKTNILDAIYILSLTKSAFATAETDCIRHGEPFYMVKGNYQIQGANREVLSSVQTGGKKTFREDKLDYSRLSDHIGKYPLVLMVPEDGDLVREGGETRRRFFDGILAQVDHGYLEDLIRYQVALKQRNALLKSWQQGGSQDLVMLDTYDHQLAEAGDRLHARRARFLVDFKPGFQKIFSQLVQGYEQTDVQYESGLAERTMAEGLQHTRSRDLVLGRTTFGVHRDDYRFLLSPGELRRLGSQGQVKSFVVALKLAQAYFMEERKGFAPLLLLDDLFDKLDDDRIAQLLEILRAYRGQVFLTDARPERTRALMGTTAVRQYEVLAGKWVRHG